jgi:hypothetical protein
LGAFADHNIYLQAVSAPDNLQFNCVAGQQFLDRRDNLT